MKKIFSFVLTNQKTPAIILLASWNCGNGGMADAHGSGPCAGNSMRVQVPFSALASSRLESFLQTTFFIFCLHLFLCSLTLFQNRDMIASTAGKCPADEQSFGGVSSNISETRHMVEKPIHIRRKADAAE